MSAEDDFKSWLLRMGYPPDQWPPSENFKEYYHSISRGPSSAVWKDLIAKVKPEQEILHQRYAVFLDGIAKNEKAEKKIDKRATPPFVPKELALWKETKQLERQIDVLENSVSSKRNKLMSIMPNDELRKRAAIQKRNKDILLKTKLLELKIRDLEQCLKQLDEIADIIATFNKNDLYEQDSLEKCLKVISEQFDKLNKIQEVTESALSSNVSTVGCTDKDSSNEKSMELNKILNRLNSEELWADILAKQNTIVKEMAELVSKSSSKPVKPDHSEKASLHLSKAASLHVALVLRTMHNRAQIRIAKKQFLQCIEEYIQNKQTSLQSETEQRIELLVLSCEKAELNAKSQINLKDILSKDLLEYCGDYEKYAEIDAKSFIAEILKVDDICVSKMKEMKNRLALFKMTGEKISNISTQTMDIINSIAGVKNNPKALNGNETCMNYDDFKHSFNRCQKGNTTSQEQYSPKSVCDFFASCLDREKSIDLSLELTNDSLVDTDWNVVPRFSKELKYFLEQFPFESNKKIVLEDGTILWINETLENISASFPVPINTAMAAMASVNCLTTVRQFYDSLTRIKMADGWSEELSAISVDVEPLSDLPQSRIEMSNRVDAIKRRNADTIQTYDKSVKILDLSSFNLSFWSDSPVRHFLSDKRTIEGDTFAHYKRRLNSRLMKFK